MKTDALFYELFQLAPETFFELLQVTPPCVYRFESIEDSLALNVLRPLLVTSEREIREHVVAWVDKIRRTPNLDAHAEEKLISLHEAGTPISMKIGF